MKDKKMNILIVGGAGYVGAIASPLIAKYYNVTVIDELWFGNNLPDNMKVIKMNCKDIKEEYLKQFDQIIYLGGVSNDPMAEFSPYTNFVENISVPINLAFMAKKVGVKRFIFASSCSVYGNTNDKLLCETDEVNNNYPYGLSKMTTEFTLLKLQNENFSVICLRKGTVCGYGPRVRFDLLINTMFKFAMTENKITAINNKINRPLLSIQDAAQAYLKCVEADYSVNGVFNIASGNYKVIDVAKIVKKKIDELEGTNIQIDVLDKEDKRDYKVSWEKAMNILDFKPKYNIEDIILELWEHKHEFGDYQDDKYYNVKTFIKLNI